MSLGPAVDWVLKINPVPGLSFAFTLFTFIVSAVNEVQSSKTQLEVLATAIGQLLATLNSEFRAARLTTAKLLGDIHRFVEKEQERGFLNALLNKDSRIATIEGFYRRIGITVSAFQISALLKVESMLWKDRNAQERDNDILDARFRALEKNHLDLRHINQHNILAMMVSIQRKLDAQESVRNTEDQFLSHTLQYLSSSSGKQVKVEDWMISPFEVEFIAEIGAGGFGTVYRGMWNRTEVAIKVVKSGAGITPDLSILRKEISVWSTLRHPHILQFLGANTLDARPFIVMPYISENARQFLQKHPDSDPIFILRDISLGLEYLHSRKVCHGDLKGTNVLVEPTGRALLCDFGLARIKADVTTRAAAPDYNIIPGSRNWMAPELLTGSSPRMPSDMYAFGMTLYELYMDEVPLATIAYSDFVELVVRSGIRPRHPDSDECPRMHKALWCLGESCWAPDPMARPSATHVHHIISQLISGTPAQSANYSTVRGPTISSETDRSPSTTSPVTVNTLGRPHRQRSSSTTGTSVSPPNEELWRLKELQVAALQKRQRVLGNKDPDTLNAMHDLASTCYRLGQLETAEELQTEVIARRKKILGPDHPDILTSMHNLTFTYRRLERLSEALDLGVVVMEKRKRILGEDHPNTLAAMQNLALTYCDLHLLREAAELQERAVDKQKRVLGREHPDMLTTMHNLASTYYEQGRFGSAEKILVATLERRKRALGKGHHATIQTMEKLIETYEKQGKSNWAKSLVAAVEDIHRPGGKQTVTFEIGYSESSTGYFPCINNKRDYLDNIALKVVFLAPA
ncbi:kinase-like domain-containing protein [Mycena latifolia]|nr:kinase-like domain-containing protein [Mycena latifolia]